jgi:hypothetical protein
MAGLHHAVPPDQSLGCRGDRNRPRRSRTCSPRSRRSPCAGGPRRDGTRDRLRCPHRRARCSPQECDSRGSRGALAAASRVPALDDGASGALHRARLLSRVGRSRRRSRRERARGGPSRCASSGRAGTGTGPPGARNIFPALAPSRRVGRFARTRAAKGFPVNPGIPPLRLMAALAWDSHAVARGAAAEITPPPPSPKPARARVNLHARRERGAGSKDPDPRGGGATRHAACHRHPSAPQ